MNPTVLLQELRALLFPWSVALLLPMPMLMAGGEHANSDIAVLYLAFGGAWLATEAFHPSRRPGSPAQGWLRMSALGLLLAVNAMVFTWFGAAAEMESNIPLPILATLGLAPSLGLVPWLTLRLRQPYAALVLGATTVALLKLAACVVARVVYGPNYIALGYVSADWRTAKLMISLMWLGTLLVSVLAAFACHRCFARARP